MSLYDPPGKNILLHNPCGLRVEINLHAQTQIELWYSPRANRSASYRDRNFSNRDDHMRLWDAITLPDLTESDFVRCEYDAFHVSIYYTDRVLRLAVSYDSPLIYLDLSEPQRVDFKSHRNNQVLTCNPHQFKIRHQERRKRFEFTAQCREAVFQYQPTIETGRSTYATANLEKNSLLVIGGDLDEDLPKLEREVAHLLHAGYDATRDQDETKIDQALRAGSFSLRNQPELERLVHVNRRVLLAMQDQQGAIRAAINRIYYLIWVRDGAIIEAFQARAGNPAPLSRWKNFLLANATRIEEEGRVGWMYGQLTNPISKWQEDGLFYAVWSVFESWTHTGVAPSSDDLFMLEEVTNWYERYCYDAEKNLFGRFFACETPFKGSRDFGIDGAVGKRVEAKGVEFDGQQVLQSFDIYINLLNWNVYLMLAEMTTDFTKVREWRRRAGEIHKALLPLVQKEVPDYGWLRLEDGRCVLAEGQGLDRTDYEWALSITPFFPTHDAGVIRKKLFEKTLAHPDGSFLAGYFSLIQSLDPLDVPVAQVSAAIELAKDQCTRPGKFFPMPYTVVEMLGIEDGDSQHDVRPQAFSIGPLLATLVGQGLRRLPHGLALRPTRQLKTIDHYEYHNLSLKVFFDEDRRGLSMNHEEVPHTWQIPEGLLRPGKNVLHFPATDPVLPGSPCLLSSTARLARVHEEGPDIVYSFDSFGWNHFRYVVPAGWTLKVQEASGSNMEHVQEEREGCLWIHFDGTGDCLIRLSPAGN